MRAISACLLGLACRYDGERLAPPARYRAADGEALVPLCPEQLGGLSTPRAPCEIVGGDGSDVWNGRARVVNSKGCDVTAAYQRGARETYRVCRALGIREMLLKARSPSCGLGCIYRHGERVVGDGVTAAWLRRHGIAVEVHPDA